jgi:hypothetical protein
MADRASAVRVRADQRAEGERRHARIGGAGLVEDDEDRRAGELQQRRQEPLQPRVAGRDRAVVHVVAEIRDDECEVGQPARGAVAGDLRQRHDPA